MNMAKTTGILMESVSDIISLCRRRYRVFEHALNVQGVRVQLVYEVQITFKKLMK